MTSRREGIGRRGRRRRWWLDVGFEAEETYRTAISPILQLGASLSCMS